MAYVEIDCRDCKHSEMLPESKRPFKPVKCNGCGSLNTVVSGSNDDEYRREDYERRNHLDLELELDHEQNED